MPDNPSPVPVLFRLVRDADESGVSGTGHVADGVAWPDGTCALRWRTAYVSTAIYASLSDLIQIHGHGGKTRVEWIHHPYDRGHSEAEQDAMENAPSASIGGLDARMSPRVPDYVRGEDQVAWLAGYEAACRAMWGADWRTCDFGWRAALTVGGEEGERG